MWLARQLHRPFVLTVHDYLEPREKFFVDREWGRRIIAVSEAVKLDLQERTGLPDDFITVIHSGVDAGDCSNKTPLLDTSRVPVVGTAGPLEAVKGFPFFLGAAARVLATGRDVEFVIAGAGPEESNLRRLAKQLNIQDRVTFVANLSEFDDALSAMDIFCLPSLQQGIGTIMLQAMAIGRPVIATRVGGVYSVVRDGETGILVPPSDSDTLAKRILELLDNPERAREIGSAARTEVLNQFSVQQMVTKTVSLYREIMSSDAAMMQSTDAYVLRR
jgi:glycosyltransferase involved in cell wall biosynthesis